MKLERVRAWKEIGSPITFSRRLRVEVTQKVLLFDVLRVNIQLSKTTELRQENALFGATNRTTRNVVLSDVVKVIRDVFGTEG